MKSLSFLLAMMAFSMVPVLRCAAAEKKPAALIYGGVHIEYVARPLHEEGIEFATCEREELADRLQSGKYNVLVLARLLDEQARGTVEEFLQRGGGVLALQPGGNAHNVETWTLTNQWLAGLGARLRWEVLEETDEDNRVADMMGIRHSYTERVEPPVSEGVKGLLMMMLHNPGAEPPMPFDYSEEWKVVVRGADSLRTRITEHHSKAAHLRKWIPEEPLDSAPPLMAVRKYRNGRVALTSLRPQWSLRAPRHCPTVEAMMTKGAGGRPSNWVGVFANAIRWLARPSMKKGMGGATTPDALLHRQVKEVKRHGPKKWAGVTAIENRPQTPGLVGARTELSSGSGSVADYVREAKAAGLKFIVFLENELEMEKADWDRLVEQCKKHSGEDFLAVPGLTYEDAQGNHLFAFADNVQFPQPDTVLEDGRLATNAANRTNALFDYVNELMRQDILSGYWRHDENWLHWADYKLYNSFPIYSFVDGKQVDDAFEEWRYWMDVGGCNVALALEIMTDPAQVKQRAANGWQVVATRPLEELDGTWHHGGFPFNGRFSQYITNGPRILDWRRLQHPSVRGEWWRPDFWQVRMGLRVASDAGLRSVTIYRGNRGVYRRWLLDGAKTFEQQIVTTNAQQHGLFVVVEDMEGRRAISMEYWNRNFINEQFICGDRCNFLGNGRFVSKDGRWTWTPVGFKANLGISPSKGSMKKAMGWEPAISLTPDAPTLPIDGRPVSWDSPSLSARVHVPGEHRELFTYPTNYLFSPEMMIGQGNFKLAYDPAEYGAEKTPIGIPYEEPEKQGKIGKNAWTSWFHLVPTKFLSGWYRLWATPVLGPTREQVARFGALQVHAVMKQNVRLEAGESVVDTHGGGGWEIYRGEKLLADGSVKETSGEFGRGTFALKMSPKGSVALIGTDAGMQYRVKGGRLSIVSVHERERLEKGAVTDFFTPWIGFSGAVTPRQARECLADFGVLDPGRTGYSAEVTAGEDLDRYLFWRVRAEDGGFAARIEQRDLLNFIPLIVEGLNERWSAHLLVRNRQWPNHRALPLREGRGCAQLDPTDGDIEVFVGHPVTCDAPDVVLSVNWKERPRTWSIEAHNPTGDPIETRLSSTPGWTVFDFDETLRLAPGTSRMWEVDGKR